MLLATVVSMMVAFGPMTIDLYLPALPAIAADRAADVGQVQRMLGASSACSARPWSVTPSANASTGRSATASAGRPVLFAGVGL